MGGRGCELCKLGNRGNLLSIETILFEFIRDVKTWKRVIGIFIFEGWSKFHGCVLCKLVKNKEKILQVFMNIYFRFLRDQFIQA